MRIKYIYSAALLLCIVPGLAHGQSIRFADRSIEAGVVTAGGIYGIAVADFDGDGWEDAYLAGSDGQSVLLRNTGGARFEDVTTLAGVRVAGDAVHPLWGDVDNDGDADLFVGVREPGASSVLFRNDGNGQFTNVSQSSGIRLGEAVGSAAFGDFDADGWLDLFVATRGTEDRLYRNSAGSTFLFEDVTEAADVAGDTSTIAMQATWIDHDRDGDLDLFAVHDANVPSRLYQNNGWLPFFDVSTSKRLIARRSAMGVAWGDFDNDGWPDAYVTNIAQGNLFRNLGAGGFEDVTEATGTGPNGMSWGTVFADFDNDGDEDLFIGNTFDFDQQRSFLYENRGGTFVNVAEEAGAALSTNTFGVAAGDFDNDGRLDLFIADEGGDNVLLINDSEEVGHALRVRLEGESVNRMAVGATVRVVSGGRTMYRTLRAGDSFCSQHSSILHVGLGASARVDTLAVSWEKGRSDVYTDLDGGGVYTIREGQPINVAVEEMASPAQVSLMQAFPHPAKGQTTIRFQLSHVDNVQLVLYDALGRVIETLASGETPAGFHELSFDASLLSPGLYVYRLETPRTHLARVLMVR